MTVKLIVENTSDKPVKKISGYAKTSTGAYLIDIPSLKGQGKKMH